MIKKLSILILNYFNFNKSCLIAFEYQWIEFRFFIQYYF